MKRKLNGLKTILSGSVLLASCLCPAGLNAQPVEPRDCAEIRMQAEQTLQRFALLLNQLADPVFYPSEREELIQNSLKPDNPGRIFYSPTVIVENDLKPVEGGAGLNDRKAGRYLHDYDLLYAKSEAESVFFTDLHFGPLREKDYVFLHIIYESTFKGRLKDEPQGILPTRRRVATVLAEKSEEQWRTYLLQINFYSSDYAFVTEYRDADCDGIAGPADECPEEAGTPRWKGCPPPPDPDYDRDGIVDSEDVCPEQMGPRCAGGCPLPAEKGAGRRQVRWQELLGNSGWDVAFDVNKNGKGELLFAGETEIGGKGKDLYMAVFDPCRKYITNRITLGGAQDDGARKVLEVAPGQYALAGYSESTGSGSRDAWLLLTDGAQKTGEKFFGTGRASEAFSDLVKDGRDRLLFTGENDGKLWLLQTSLEGEVLQETLYEGRGAATGTALALSAGGDIYLTGYETRGKRDKLLVLRYKEEENTLEVIYEKSDARGLDLIVDRKGRLLVAGSIYTPRSRDDIFALGLAPDGKPLWAEALIFGGLGVDVASAVLETGKGDYLLAGYSSSYADGARREKLWAHLLSPGGEPLWKEPLFWGDRFSERAYALTQIEANGVVAAGLSRSSIPSKKANKSDFWLVGIALQP